MNRYQKIRFNLAKWRHGTKLSRSGIITAILLLAVGIGMFGRWHYDDMHTKLLYDVIHNQQNVGIVSDPSVVTQYIQKRKEALSEQYPDASMKLDIGDLQFKQINVQNGQPENQMVLSKLSRLLSSYTPGVALKINGQVVGYFHNKQEADSVLQQYRSYELSKKQAKQNPIHILSTSEATEQVLSKQVLQQTDGFVQQVDESSSRLEPSQISHATSVLKLLETGGIPTTSYIVQTGDCLSCIAANLHIPESVILQDNPAITSHSTLQVGQVLNITQYQPMLKIKTMEQIQEVLQIPYTKNYKNDPNLGIGYIKLSRPGQYGKKQVLLQVEKENGTTVSSSIVQSTVIQTPIPATYLKGTNPVDGPFSSKSDYSNAPKGEFLSWPFTQNYQITSPFGWRPDPFNGTRSFHDGIDIGAPEGTAIHAAASGTVLHAGWYGGFGNCVIIDNGHDIHTLYGHMRTGSIKVTVGEHVLRGQVIGHVGMTGRATGPHLHFGVYDQGTAVDPWDLLKNR